MRQPLIEFNVEKAVNEMITEAEVKPDSRIKAVGAILRGTGGGSDSDV